MRLSELGALLHQGLVSLRELRAVLHQGLMSMRELRAVLCQRLSVHEYCIVYGLTSSPRTA